MTPSILTHRGSFFLGKSTKQQYAANKLLRKSDRLRMRIAALTAERRALQQGNGESLHRLMIVQQALRRKTGRLLQLEEQYRLTIGVHTPSRHHLTLHAPQNFVTTATPRALLSDEYMTPDELYEVRKEIRSEIIERKRQSPPTPMSYEDLKLPPSRQNQRREARTEQYAADILRSIREQIRQVTHCPQAVETLLRSLDYEDAPLNTDPLSVEDHPAYDSTKELFASLGYEL